MDNFNNDLINNDYKGIFNTKEYFNAKYDKFDYTIDMQTKFRLNIESRFET